MPASIVVGCQWGDEGKGKIVDFLSKDFDLVVRYQGGNNAGHTVVVDEKQYKFHLLPSGAARGKKIFIAAGLVVNPKVLLEEISKLGSEPELTIDPRAQIIMPYHLLLDSALEKFKGSKFVGTTGRGIGPCYEDKAARLGIRFEDILEKKTLEERLSFVYRLKKEILEKVFSTRLEQSLGQMLEEYYGYGKRLKKYAGDVSCKVEKALSENKKILFEGAQGTFLDIGFGTYPYVTSSHPIVSGCGIGVGMNVKKIGEVVGISKAYCTRVGEGPFPTELSGKLADKLREKGAEYGTTTGRPRRIGWLDLCMLRTANRLNGLTSLAITKADVLSNLEEIKICNSYKCNGEMLKEMPCGLEEIKKCKPVYETFPGFELTGKEKTFSELPKELQTYLQFIEEQSGVPIKYVSIGPQRDKTIVI